MSRPYLYRPLIAFLISKVEWKNAFKYWWWTRRPDFAEFTLRERPGNEEGRREPVGRPVTAQ